MTGGLSNPVTGSLRTFRGSKREDDSKILRVPEGSTSAMKELLASRWMSPSKEYCSEPCANGSCVVDTGCHHVSWRHVEQQHQQKKGRNQSQKEQHLVLASLALKLQRVRVWIAHAQGRVVRSCAGEAPRENLECIPGAPATVLLQTARAAVLL